MEFIPHEVLAVGVESMLAEPCTSVLRVAEMSDDFPESVHMEKKGSVASGDVGHGPSLTRLWFGPPFRSEKRVIVAPPMGRPTRLEAFVG